MSSVLPRFGSALAWTMVTSVGTVAVQFGLMMAVSRLLSPGEIGTFAIAGVVPLLLRHCGEIGLVSALVREPVLDRMLTGSATSLAFLFSVALALLLAIVAPFVGDSTSEHVALVNRLVQFLSISMFVSGVGAPAQAFLQRELRFRELGLLQVISFAFGTGAITVPLALSGQGVWSLAWGDLASKVVLTTAFWLCVPSYWSVAWSWRHVRGVALVSAKMTILRLLDALWTQVPLLTGNARLSAYQVGLYQRGQTLVDMGVSYTTGRVNMVLFPIMASRQHLPKWVTGQLPLIVGVYSLLLFPATAFVAVMAQDLIQVMLGPQWTAGAQSLAIVMLAYTILHTSQPISSQLEARAEFVPRILGSCVGAVLLAVFGLSLARTYGPTGLAIAAVISASGTTIINFWAGRYYLRLSLSRLMSWVFLGMALGACVYAVTFIVSLSLPSGSNPPLVRLSVAAVAASVTLVASFRAIAGETKRSTLRRYVPAWAGNSGVSRLVGL